MVRETYQDEQLAKELNEGYIPVRLEGRGHMDLVRQYGVTGAPTTLIFTPEGQEKHRFVGFHSPEEYWRELAKSG